MANFIALTGFVTSEPQTKGNVAKFSIKFYDTKKDGNAVYSFMTVKVFDYSSIPAKDDIVSVTGSFHKYKWQEKEYCEVWCNYDGWAKVERRPKEGSHDKEPVAEPESADIPF